MDTPPTAAQSPTAAPRRWAGCIWFPVLVVALVVAWWLRRATYSHYMTYMHVLSILVAAIAISVWYVQYGALKYRTRLLIVGIGWLALGAVLAVFRPVYNGDMGIYAWRWRFAAADDAKIGTIESNSHIVDWKTTPDDYARFLGTGYWPEVSGVNLARDWKEEPPREQWRREIGAGWSGFSIVGNYAFTQEQRSADELVSCYRLDSGEPVWTHADTTRFDPADFTGGLGGIGPRATPTIHGDFVLTQGATGIVNCLDARSGEVVWMHDTCAETGATIVTWGKAGSPLVVDDMVIVSVGAPTDTELREVYNSSLVAYDLATGVVRWAAGDRQASYVSPVLTTLAGERQIISINESWVTAHRVKDGMVLWEFPWSSETDTTATCTQPIPLPGDRVFLSKGYGVGAALLQIARDEKGILAATPLWSPPICQVMKTKFANVVLRDGFVYGLDDVLLECMELESGTVKWKKRRQPEFGHGQIILLGDAILVLSETGELALVDAKPDRYEEHGSIQALDPEGVTWNTLAFSSPYLLVRNAREAACYRLPIVEQGKSEVEVQPDLP